MNEQVWGEVLQVLLYFIAFNSTVFILAYWTVPTKTVVGWHLMRVTGLLGASALFGALAQTFELSRGVRIGAWVALLLFLGIELTFRTYLLVSSRKEARQEMRLRRLARDSGESEPTDTAQ